MKIEIDEANDILTIDGRKFSGEFLRKFTTPDNRLFRAWEENGVVLIHTYCVGLEAFESWHERYLARKSL